MDQSERVRRAIHRARALVLRARGLGFLAQRLQQETHMAAQRSWAVVGLARLNLPDCRESLSLLRLSRERVQRELSRRADGQDPRHTPSA